MAISIQGDWGTGKTTILNLVDQDLSEKQSDKVLVIRINAWQYSQLDLGDRLVFSLLQAIGEAIDQTIDAKTVPDTHQRDEIKIKLKAYLIQVGRLAALALPELVEALPIPYSGFWSRMMNAFISRPKHSEPNAPKFEDVAKELDNLREYFKATVNSTGKRVVIMIDDLDRLRPEKAVDVLEAMKAFLETENCVFLLAIDRKVINLGVKHKYGKALSDDKVQVFFDKMIQTPFSVPVQSYDLSSLFKEHLQSDGLKLATYAVGTNPRAIRRILNSFSLNEGILKASNKSENRSVTQSVVQVKQLFAMQCLEVGFPDTFDSVVFGTDDPGKKMGDILDAIEASELTSSISPEKERENFFLKEMASLFQTSDSDNIDGLAFNIAARVVTTTVKEPNSINSDSKVDELMLEGLTETYVGDKWRGVGETLLKHAAASNISLKTQAATKNLWTIFTTEGRTRIGLIRFNKKYVLISLVQDFLKELYASSSQITGLQDLQHEFMRHLKNAQCSSESFSFVESSAVDAPLPIRVNSEESAAAVIRCLIELVSSSKG